MLAKECKLGSDDDDLVRRIRRDLADGYDEQLELELEDRNLDQLDEAAIDIHDAEYKLARREYFSVLFAMQGELVKLQDYTRAKEVMLERTHIAEAPWWVVQAVDKKKARLNCIHHLLGQIPYPEVEHRPIQLPPRVRHDDYVRNPVPAEILVPQRY